MPIQTKHIPNIISIFRFILVPPLVLALLDGSYRTAIYLFAVAGISDGIDGYLARHFRWTSRLGSILDPLADKCLQVSAYITLAWLGLLPIWLAAVVLLRDLVIVTGAVIYHLSFGRVEMEPSVASKINTFFQILLVLLVIFDKAFYTFPAWVIEVFIFSVLATTLISGTVYVIIWSRRYAERRKQLDD
jgi:cardiolipin synthase